MTTTKRERKKKFRRSISLSLSPPRLPVNARESNRWGLDLEILKEGVLLKAVEERWESRWFRLLPEYLVFYRKEPPSNERGLATVLMLGIIALKDCKVHESPSQSSSLALDPRLLLSRPSLASIDDGEETKSMPRPAASFSLIHGETCLLLGSVSKTEVESWKLSITKAIDVLCDPSKRHHSVTRYPSALKSESGNPWEIAYEDLELLGKIGHGEFGDVFKGRLWGTEVAVKTLKEASDELFREVAILSELRHPNVILYIGACSTHPNSCIVTEWCKFGNLFDLLHNSTELLDMQTVVHLAVGIAQGMNYLHNLDRKIIHRDLKSHNILVSHNFTAKVADFGLSHVRRPINDAKGGHYGIFGTPEWMAPEVMMGKKYSEKIDVYSFGIVLCELLTRSIPFHDKYDIKDYHDVVDAVLDDRAVPTIPSWAGSKLKLLILRCLDHNPEQRPSFQIILEDLQNHYVHKAISQPQTFFEYYDIPRIMSLLLSPHTETNQKASVEISQRLDSKGVMQSCLLSDPNALSVMIVRLGTILSRDCWRFKFMLRESVKELTAEKGQVQVQILSYLEALVKLLQLCSEEMRAAHRSALKEEGGLRALLTLLGAEEPNLRRKAREVMSVLAKDLTLAEQIRFVDLSFKDLGAHDVNGLSALKEMVEEEILSLEDRIQELQELAENKRSLSRRLDVALKIMKTEFNKRGPTVHSRSESRKLSSPLGSPVSVDFEIDVPDAFTEYFGTSERMSITSALVLEDESRQIWTQRVLFLFGDGIHIFEDTQSEPDDAVGVFHLKTRKGQAASADIYKFPGKPNCLCLHNGTSEPLVISLRNKTQVLHWAHMTDPSNHPHGPLEDTFGFEIPVDDEECNRHGRDLGMGLSVVVEEVKELTDEFEEYFGMDCILFFGSLVLKMGKGMPWRTVFCVLLKSRELRMFASSFDEPDDAWGVVYLRDDEDSVGVYVTEEMDESIESDWKGRSFTIETSTQSFLFCAKTRLERDHWTNVLKSCL